MTRLVMSIWTNPPPPRNKHINNLGFASFFYTTPSLMVYSIPPTGVHRWLGEHVSGTIAYNVLNRKKALIKFWSSRLLYVWALRIDVKQLVLCIGFSVCATPRQADPFYRRTTTIGMLSCFAYLNCSCESYIDIVYTSRTTEMGQLIYMFNVWFFPWNKLDPYLLIFPTPTISFGIIEWQAIPFRSLSNFFF